MDAIRDRTYWLDTKASTKVSVSASLILIPLIWVSRPRCCFCICSAFSCVVGLGINQLRPQVGAEWLLQLAEEEEEMLRVLLNQLMAPWRWREMEVEEEVGSAVLPILRVLQHHYFWLAPFLCSRRLRLFKRKTRESSISHVGSPPTSSPRVAWEEGETCLCSSSSSFFLCVIILLLSLLLWKIDTNSPPPRDAAATWWRERRKEGGSRKACARKRKQLKLCLLVIASPRTATTNEYWDTWNNNNNNMTCSCNLLFIYYLSIWNVTKAREPLPFPAPVWWRSMATRSIDLSIHQNGWARGGQEDGIKKLPSSR